MDTVVLHATGHRPGSHFASVVRYLQSTGGTRRQKSYHYLVDKDGAVAKGCPASKCAFHAGISDGPHGPSVNETSVGIALFNANDGVDPYTMDQYEAIVELCRALRSQFPELRYLTTHYAVSWGRKSDPRGFPVLRLAVDTQLVVWKPERAQWLLAHRAPLKFG